MLTLDHLVITATDLVAGTAEIEDRLGLPLAPGGRHAAMGTHNRLLSLGPEEYLEVIAIDPEAPPPGRARWFALDAYDGAPALTHWAARTGDLDAALAVAPEGSGTALFLARGDLRWRMAVPEGGRAPFSGLFPALLEWQGAAHPAPRLPDHGARLEALVLESPEAEALRAALAPLLSDPRCEIREAPAIRLSARIATPRGRVTL